MLTDEQVEAFERDGFVVVPDFLSADDRERLRSNALATVEAWEPTTERTVFTTDEQERTSNAEFLSSGGTTWCFFEEEAFGPDGELTQPKELSINKIGHAQHDLDPVVRDVVDRSGIGDVARDVGLDDPLALQSMYIFKQPSIGGEVSCHQDATFLSTDPVSVTGFWIALEDATLDNGCLWAQPGGHRGPLRQLFKRNRPDEPSAADGTVFEELDPTPLPSPPTDPFDPSTSTDLVPLPVEAGTLVVLHGLLPHWSGPNRSGHSRHAYTLHCISASAEYPAWNWLQRPDDLPLRAI
ncbi:MAG: phytanoyl-CoA dioxygenase family protein [Actinomycetota bacterium]